jgi:large subunit ribosomal protein L20
MPRVRKGAARKQKHKRVLKQARGYHGPNSRRYRIAKEKVYRSGVFATRDRKNRKRDFRRLWIQRISAACRQRGVRYSQFMAALYDQQIDLNRKMLAEIAVDDPDAFDAILQAAGLEATAAA